MSLVYKEELARKSVDTNKLDANNADTAGYVLSAVGSGGKFLWIPAGGGAPSGPAGGDLDGTYPNPTLAILHAGGGPTGGATVAPIITVDAKGRVTALSSATITGVTPSAHVSSHANGGSDELNVAGLSGLLADAQTPAAHASSHQSGGGDTIKLDDLAAPDDNTDLNASVTAHGLCPKGPSSGFTVLSSNGTTVAYRAPGVSGSGLSAMLVKSADQTGIGSSATNVTDLTVTVTAGQTIAFTSILLCQTSGTTIGGDVGCNGPAASAVFFEVREWTSTTISAFAQLTALDTFVGVTSGPGATTRPYWCEGTVTFSAGGTFAIRAKAESGGTMSVLKGSFLQYALVG